ncbi:MAG: gamma-glutamyltransferase [Vulcanimicrobiota bacterium]
MRKSSHRRRMALLLSALFLSTLWSVQAQPLLEKNQHISRRAEHAMVVSGEPLATQVGNTILQGGGNAVDAAVAVALSLAVTLPRAGNLGGGGFAMILDQEGQVHALDFRETAPGATHREFYLDQRHTSRRGASAVGVPGTVAGLWEMHQKFGVIPWNKLVEPARRLAQEGFPTSAWLADGVTSSQELLGAYPATRKIFMPAGEPPKIGSLFRQRDLGATLKRLSRGPSDFYTGKTAELLVEGVQAAGGVLSREDLAGYKAVWRKPLSGDFRGYQVWSMPPPSSGGLHLLQMLELTERLDSKPATHNSAAHLHLVAEAMRLAYRDRARHLGDPDFVDVPVEELLSPEYLQTQYELIPQEKAGDSEELAPELFHNPVPESPDTTHFNVVDKDGMAVSFTYTLNFSYGSGFMAPGTGVLLNNEMDDFNARPGEPNAYGLIGSSANDVEAGKRPLSSMTPTLITKDGRFFAAIGAPGGSRIITGVFQAVFNLLAYGLNAQTSVSAPRIHHQWYPDKICYEFGISADSIKLLESWGHKCEPIYAVAHVLSIVRDPEGHLEAGLDPRRPAYVEGY